MDTIVPQTPAPLAPQPQNKSNALKIVLSVLLLAVVIGGGYLFMTSDKGTFKGSVGGNTTIKDSECQFTGLRYQNENLKPLGCVPPTADTCEGLKMTFTGSTCIATPVEPIIQLVMCSNDGSKTVAQAQSEGMDVVDGACYAPYDNPINVAARELAEEVKLKSQQQSDDADATPESAASCSTKGLLYNGAQQCVAISSVSVNVCKQLVAKYNLGVTCEAAQPDKAVQKGVVEKAAVEEVDESVGNVINNYYSGSSANAAAANRAAELEAELLAIKEGRTPADIAARTAANLAESQKTVVIDPAAAQKQQVAVIAEPVVVPASDNQSADELRAAALKKLNRADAQAIERAFAENPTPAINAEVPVVRVSSAKQTMNGSSIRGDTGPEILLYPSLVAMANGAYIMLRKKRK